MISVICVWYPQRIEPSDSFLGKFGTSCNPALRPCCWLRDLWNQRTNVAVGFVSKIIFKWWWESPRLHETKTWTVAAQDFARFERDHPMWAAAPGRAASVFWGFDLQLNSALFCWMGDDLGLKGASHVGSWRKCSGNEAFRCMSCALHCEVFLFFKIPNRHRTQFGSAFETLQRCWGILCTSNQINTFTSENSNPSYFWTTTFVFASVCVAVGTQSRRTRNLRAFTRLQNLGITAHP